MLAIGRALMTNPKLLILDEATEGLAPLIRAEIWACLTQLKAEGQSILRDRQERRRAGRLRRPPRDHREGPRRLDRHRAELEGDPTVKDRFCTCTASSWPDEPGINCSVCLKRHEGESDDEEPMTRRHHPGQ